jgi:hypothetical protein
MSDSFQEWRAKLLSTRTPPSRNPSVHENNSLKDPNIWLYKYMIMQEERMLFLLTIPFLGYLVVVIHSFIHSSTTES